MPSFFRLISEYFWLIALAFGVVNYVRARKLLAARSDPGVDEACDYLRVFTVGLNLPWVVMGAGKLLGYTPTVWYYFRPQDRNPFVIAWLVVIFLLTLGNALWVFAGGAEKIRDLNLMAAFGQNASKPPSLTAIKLFSLFGVLFFPVWVYIAVSMDAPLPK